MNFFEKVVAFLQTTNESPTNYGGFHLVSIGLCILVTVLLCVFAKDVSNRTFRKIIGVMWLAIVGLEIYKQIVFSFNAETVTWDYSWYAFPYQLCSTPLYLLPFVVFAKDGKFRDGVMMFISTFAFFGGVCVMVFPNDVFATQLLGVQIQTMVHHSVQIISGIYIVVYYRNRIKKRSFAFAIVIFIVLLTLAMVLNIVMYHVLDESFNMFYISPYYGCHLPILSGIYAAVPYVVFFFIYSLGFILASVVMILLIVGGIKLCDFISEKVKG